MSYSWPKRVVQLWKRVTSFTHLLVSALPDFGNNFPPVRALRICSGLLFFAKTSSRNCRLETCETLYGMKLYIKYMVSIRCKMIVRAELAKLGLAHGMVDLGEVEVNGSVSAAQRQELRNALLKSGLELMDDKKAILIQRIKNLIVEMVHYEDELPKVKNSEYIGQKIEYDYTYLANMFSEATGVTIEHYIIAHKIERVKELLLYDELTLTQVSYKLNYSSVAHLSKQFKQVTGLTPTFFKKLKQKKRTALEDV